MVQVNRVCLKILFINRPQFLVDSNGCIMLIKFMQIYITSLLLPKIRVNIFHFKQLIYSHLKECTLNIGKRLIPVMPFKARFSCIFQQNPQRTY